MDSNQTKRIVQISAYFDTSETAVYRGWLVDLVFENGERLTIPAPPQYYYLDQNTESQKIEEATRCWLKAKQHVRKPASGLYVAV